MAHQIFYTRLLKEMGITGWALSGGGSLASHLDMFFEVSSTAVQLLSLHFWLVLFFPASMLTEQLTIHPYHQCF